MSSKVILLLGVLLATFVVGLARRIEDVNTTGARVKRNMKPGDKWDTLTIPYVLDKTLFKPRELKNIQRAFNEYARYSCISFVPSNGTEPKVMSIYRGGGCYSKIGYSAKPGKKHGVSIGKGCAWKRSIIIHEIFHALGSGHQQSRPDRDEYVKINWENVRDTSRRNFKKHSGFVTYDVPYAFNSVMAYGDKSFSKNGLHTIEPLPQYEGAKMGKGATFAFEDLQVLNRHFKCDQVSGLCEKENPCKPDQYRGKDCNCYCKKVEDLKKPAVLCSELQ